MLASSSTRAPPEPALRPRFWGYGWTVGANAGVLFPVGKVHLGGLLNFYLRNPLKSCVTANGTDTCLSDNFDRRRRCPSFAAML